MVGGVVVLVGGWVVVVVVRCCSAHHTATHYFHLHTACHPAACVPLTHWRIDSNPTDGVRTIVCGSSVCVCGNGCVCVVMKMVMKCQCLYLFPFPHLVLFRFRLKTVLFWFLLCFVHWFVFVFRLVGSF